MATEKQKKAFQASLENSGNISKSLREAGYSHKTAKTPKSITSSKGWQELMDEYIPEDLLQKKLHEGLNATKPSYNKDGEMNLDQDFSTRHKYLDTAFKLRGSYAAEKHDITSDNKPITGFMYKAPDDGNTDD